MGVVGSIVGLAAFALQLAQSVVTLKEFCHNVKNAPDDVQELVHEIEIMGKFAERLGAKESQEAAQEIQGLAECEELAQRTLQRIKATSLELQTQIGRKKTRTSIKVALKQDAIERLCRNLARIRQDMYSLQLLCTSFETRAQMESLKRSLDDIRAGQAQMVGYTQILTMERTTGIRDADSNTSRCKRIGRTKEQDEHALEVHLVLPRWLCEYAWNLSFRRAAGRWTMSLRTHRVIGRDHPVWRLCTLGDWHGVRTLLEAREITVHDVRADDLEIGWTVLSVRVSSRSPSTWLTYTGGDDGGSL